MSRNRTTTEPGEGICRTCGWQCASVALTSCPGCGGAIAAATAARATTSRTGLFDLPPMRYPNAYVWFVFVSTLDIALTWIILLLHNGQEVNPIANAVIAHAGLPGLVGFKFALVVFVVVLCEWVGRSKPHTGFKLSEWAVAITAIPVVISFVQLLGGR